MMEIFVNQRLNPILFKNDRMVGGYQEALKEAFQAQQTQINPLVILKT